MSDTDRARKMEETLTRQAAELRALYETLIEINAQRDVPTLLRAIVDRAARLIGARMGGLYLFRPEDQTLELVVGHNLPGDYTGTRLRLGEGVSGRIAQTGQPMMIDDYLHWEGRARVYDGIPFRRVLGVPLRIRDRVIGTINLTDDTHTGSFSEDDIRLVSLFADQAAIAVENARLYEQAQQEIAERERAENALRQRNRELALLNEVNRAFTSTLDLDQVIVTILDEVRHLLGVVACSIWLIDPETNEPVCRQATGPFSESVRGWRLPPDEGFVGWVARHGKSLIVPDALADERHYRRVDRTTGLNLRSILSAPLHAPRRDRVIGVIQVVDERVDRFDATDLWLIEMLAAAAATAVENARLYEDVQRELAERVRAEERIQAALREKDVLLKEIHHRVKNNLQIISSLLDLQSDYIRDPHTRAMFDDSQRRIRIMALIHEQLYQSPDLARISFREYVDSLTSQLLQSFAVTPSRITLIIDVADVPMTPDIAIPCGLIINELVSNALKHAFPDARAGEIRIELKPAGERQLVLRISDNGVGLPSAVDFRTTSSLGLQLVYMLSRQLRGTLEQEQTVGTAFTIIFPVPDTQTQ